MKFGEIYWVEFTANSIGHEFRGRRPAIIIQSDLKIKNSTIITVMPLTGNLNNKLSDDVLVPKDLKNNLFTDSMVKVYYIMSFDKKRLVKKIGFADDKIVEKIKKYLKIHFGLGDE